MQSEFAYVGEVAEELRRIASNYENPVVQEFFHSDRLVLRHVTNSGDVVAHAFLIFTRDNFLVELLPIDSQSNRPLQLVSRWEETSGASLNDFKIILRNRTSVEFIPEDEKSHLLLTVVWQVFYEALNTSHHSFYNPVESGMGERLREVATHLAENQQTIGPSAKFCVSEVPTSMSERDFSATHESQFPELHQVVVGWRLTEVLGAGGFGKVFKAENSTTGEFAAIKLMSPTRTDKTLIPLNSHEYRVRRKRFLDEASLSTKVNSPFTVSAIDVGSNPWPWIRYPLVDGVSVEKAILGSDNPEFVWWNLAHDLLSALSTIHLEGLLHKDVKPDNILYSDEKFVLLDFGIGHVPGYSELLGKGIGGTYGFMAPELFLPEYSARASGFEIDIFSAGMTLLNIFDSAPCMLMGHAQYEAGARGNIQPLKDLMRHSVPVTVVPEAGRDFLASMLEYEPEKRPLARNLLKIVAKYVDLDEKIDLIQAHKEKSYFPVDEKMNLGTEEQTMQRIKGPLNSWKPLEDYLYTVIERIRPNYFVVTLESTHELKEIYVQGMSGYGGWFLEAMSGHYTDSRLSDATSRNLLRMNWTPPSASEPNFTMSLDNPKVSDVCRILTSSIEFGYGLKPSQVQALVVTTQGSGKY